MKTISAVHSDWTARLTARLAESRPSDVDVCAVVVSDTEARSAWTRAAGPDLAVIDGTDTAAVTGAAAGVDGLLTAGPDPGGSVPRIAYTLLSADGIVAADPVRWALLTGADRLSLAVAGHAVVVEVAGATYGDAITACATALAGVLCDVTLTDSQWDATADQAAGDSLRLPLDRAAFAVDWSAPAELVARHVRAGTGAADPAWTWLAGFPVSLAGAEATPGPRAMPPGTILAHVPGRAVVQAGDGTVTLTSIRDAVGVLRPEHLPPGHRFNADPGEEFRVLRRRIADLERAVERLVRMVA